MISNDILVWCERLGCWVGRRRRGPVITRKAVLVPHNLPALNRHFANDSLVGFVYAIARSVVDKTELAFGDIQHRDIGGNGLPQIPELWMANRNCRVPCRTF